MVTSGSLAATTAISVLVFLLAHGALGAISTAPYVIPCGTLFHCIDGNGSIPVNQFCDKKRDCSDGSDEGPFKCEDPNTIFFPGEILEMHVRHENGWIVKMRLMDSEYRSNQLNVGPEIEKGRLPHSIYTACESGGVHCKNVVRQDKELRPRGFTGKVTYVVQRNVTSMMVWLKDHPEAMAVLPAPMFLRRLDIFSSTADIWFTRAECPDPSRDENKWRDLYRPPLDDAAEWGTPTSAASGTSRLGFLLLVASIYASATF